MKQFPIGVVCKWLGNSPKVALTHYYQMTDADFEAALDGKKATQNTTQSRADRRGPARTGKDTHPRKHGKNEKAPAMPGLQMSLSGLENIAGIGGILRSLLGGNAECNALIAELLELIELWPSLSPATRTRLAKLAGLKK